MIWEHLTSRSETKCRRCEEPVHIGDDVLYWHGTTIHWRCRSRWDETGQTPAAVPSDNSRTIFLRPTATGPPNVSVTVTENPADLMPEYAPEGPDRSAIREEAPKLDPGDEIQTGPAAPQRERLLKVFEFLKAYTELRYPPVRDIGQQLRVLWLKNLPEHPSVEVFQGDAEPTMNQKMQTSFSVLRALT